MLYIVTIGKFHHFRLEAWKWIDLSLQMYETMKTAIHSSKKNVITALITDIIGAECLIWL